MSPRCFKFVVTNLKEVPVKRIVIGCSLALLVSAVACKRTFNDNAGVKNAGELRFNTTGPWKIEYSTPLGMKLFKESLSWIDNQPDNRAQPANCAFNVSDVYENAGFDGQVYRTVSSPLVLGMMEKAEAKGGKVIRMRTKSKADFIRVLNQELGGKIPVGAMIAGCENTTCEGTAGAGHIGMLGDVDSNGYLQVYHNNWYRPDNEGGRWKAHMISKDHYNNGCLRQWMPTPWLKVIRNNPSNPDLITDVVSAFPSQHGIDDLDPFTYYGFVGIAREMWDEIQEGKLTRGSVNSGGGGGSGGGNSGGSGVATTGKTCKVVASPAGSAANIRNADGALITTLPDGFSPIKIRGIIDSTKASLEFSKDGVQWGAQVGKPAFLHVSQIGECR
jgi:hypothetical protein